MWGNLTDGYVFCYSQALILTVMYERAMGQRSPWWPYFAMLPTESEPLPFLWKEEDVATWLEGTEVFRRIVEDLPAMRADHARCMGTLFLFYFLFPCGQLV